MRFEKSADRFFRAPSGDHDVNQRQQPIETKASEFHKPIPFRHNQFYLESKNYRHRLEFAIQDLPE